MSDCAFNCTGNRKPPNGDARKPRPLAKRRCLLPLPGGVTYGRSSGGGGVLLATVNCLPGLQAESPETPTGAGGWHPFSHRFRRWHPIELSRSSPEYSPARQSGNQGQIPSGAFFDKRARSAFWRSGADQRRLPDDGHRLRLSWATLRLPPPTAFQKALQNLMPNDCEIPCHVESPTRVPAFVTPSAFVLEKVLAKSKVRFAVMPIP